jgi:hypothetical protein
LALRCRLPHCLTQLFDAVYWMEHAIDLLVQESGENSGKKLQKLQKISDEDIGERKYVDLKRAIREQRAQSTQRGRKKDVDNREPGRATHFVFPLKPKLHFRVSRSLFHYQGNSSRPTNRGIFDSINQLLSKYPSLKNFFFANYDFRNYYNLKESGDRHVI